MSKSVRRRRRRRERALEIAHALLKERGEVSTQELNRAFGMAQIKSSVQFAGSIMRPLVISGAVEKNVTGENRAYYRLSSEEE